MIRPIEEVLLGPTELDSQFSENQQDMIALAVAEAIQLPGVDGTADALTRICADWVAFRHQIAPQIRELIRAVENSDPRTKTARAIIVVESFLEVHP